MVCKQKYSHRFCVIIGVLILLIVVGCVVLFSISSVWSKIAEEATEEVPDVEYVPWELPDTAFSSVDTLDFTVTVYDTLTSGNLVDTANLYTLAGGVLNFRGTCFRVPAEHGRLPEEPLDITVQWSFSTDFDTTTTEEFGQWGGGTGWTGQPLLVNWPDSMIQKFALLHDTIYFSEASSELIIGSLSGKVYFLDPKTGKAVRKAFDAGNPIKGTPSVDPLLNGMLYVGQGVPHKSPFGLIAIDLKKHKQAAFYSGRDPKSCRGWGAFDSSPIVVGDFLFWPGENGTIYKFLRTDSMLHLHTTLRYRLKGKNAPGVESSLAVYKNYGFFGDNHGNIICVNLNTMRPVWRFFNLDDTDATLVLELENDMPYLYTGCEVDKQGYAGVSQFVKLNALTGELIWAKQINCRKVTVNKKIRDGGMLGTPLIGAGNCSSYIYSNFSQIDSAYNGHLIAFDKSNGSVLFRTPLEGYSWSSPVGFIAGDNEFLVFTGDVLGYVYLIRGSNGEVLIKKRIGINFESSPIIVENGVVFGSRGRKIYRLEFE